MPRCCFAVIPAAGKSRRMGRPKLALPLGDRSVLEWVVAALRQAGVHPVVVVVGPHVPELVPLAQASGAEVCRLAQETPEMRATVEHGLRFLEEHYHPSAEDCWLLVPADQPTLDAAVVRRLLEVQAATPGALLLVPTFQGRRGHPTLIAWHHVAGIRALASGLGLNAYLRQHAAQTLEVPIASPAILCDLDTPEDYERMQTTWHANRPTSP